MSKRSMSGSEVSGEKNRYRTTNPPKESITEDEEDGVRHGTDQIRASVDTVASDGIGRNEFQLETSNLEQWLSDIGATESYDDIKDDILSGTETTIHLSQPISTVTLVMPKPKR